MIANESGLRPCPQRIDAHDYFDLRSWAKRFGVPVSEVRRAIMRVGDVSSDVETYLRSTPGAVAGGEDNG